MIKEQYKLLNFLQFLHHLACSYLAKLQCINYELPCIPQAYCQALYQLTVKVQPPLFLRITSSSTSASSGHMLVLS